MNDPLIQQSSAPAPAPAAAAEQPRKPVSGRRVPDIIEEAAQKGVKVTLTATGYELDGFYRNGAMRIETDAGGALSAIDRKEKKTAIRSFDDLVKLNFSLWKASRDKAEFMTPPREWLEEFSRLGLVQRQVIFVPA